MKDEGPPFDLCERTKLFGDLHPFSSSPLRHLLFAILETAADGNSPEPGRQYLCDTFGQIYWTRRERFIFLSEWLAVLGNAVGMNEWIADSEAARILAGKIKERPSLNRADRFNAAEFPNQRTR